jgi:hypothetical protein
MVVRRASTGTQLRMRETRDVVCEHALTFGGGVLFHSSEGRASLLPSGDTAGADCRLAARPASHVALPDMAQMEMHSSGGASTVDKVGARCTHGVPLPCSCLPEKVAQT